MSRITCQSAALFAHPWAIVIFPFLCVAWELAGWGELALTLALSILAISTTQLVLSAQEKDTRAIHLKLDALIAGTDADDDVAGVEKV